MTQDWPQDSDEDAVLFTSRTIASLIPGGIPALLGLVAAVTLGVQHDRWGWLLVGCFALQVVMRLWVTWRAHQLPWLIRVDATGVTWWETHTLLPWTSVADIRIAHRRSLWRLLGNQRVDVLLIDHAERAFAERAQTRPTGHRIRTRYLNADTERIVETVRRFSGACIEGTIS